MQCVYESMEPRQRYYPLSPHEVNQAVYRLTPAGTTEVAELVGDSRQVVNRYLRQLEEQGTIWSKKVGPTTVWMHPWIMLESGWEPSNLFERHKGRPSFGTSSRSAPSQRRLWGHL